MSRLVMSTALALVLGAGGTALAAGEKTQSQSGSQAGAANDVVAALCSGSPAMASGGDQANSDQILARFDQNGDGQISQEEYTQTCADTGAGAAQGAGAEGNFAQLDADGDGNIAMAELDQKMGDASASSGQTAMQGSDSTAGASGGATGSGSAGGQSEMQAQTESTAGAGTEQQAQTGDSQIGQQGGAAGSDDATRMSETQGQAGDEPWKTALGNRQAEEIIGKDVVNAKGEDVGQIEDLVISGDNVLHAVVSVGGFLGIGDKEVALPFEEMQLGAGEEDQVMLMSETTEDELKSLPEFQREQYRPLPGREAGQAPANQTGAPAGGATNGTAGSSPSE